MDAYSLVVLRVGEPSSVPMSELFVFYKVRAATGYTSEQISYQVYSILG